MNTLSLLYYYAQIIEASCEWSRLQFDGNDQMEDVTNKYKLTNIPLLYTTIDVDSEEHDWQVCLNVIEQKALYFYDYKLVHEDFYPHLWELLEDLQGTSSTDWILSDPNEWQRDIFDVLDNHFHNVDEYNYHMPLLQRNMEFNEKAYNALAARTGTYYVFSMPFNPELMVINVDDLKNRQPEALETLHRICDHQFDKELSINENYRDDVIFEIKVEKLEGGKPFGKIKQSNLGAIIVLMNELLTNGEQY